jgi:hypothetical protein
VRKCPVYLHSPYLIKARRLSTATRQPSAVAVLLPPLGEKVRYAAAGNY